MGKVDYEEFAEEMREYVKDIVTGEFRGVETPEVLKKLYVVSGQDADACHDELIYDVIEELGGEPYDPSVEEDDYEEPLADEGDY